MLRKGSAKNVMVFPESDYDTESFAFSNGQYTFTHQAFGADLFRYSTNFGQNWTQWQNWQDTTTIDAAEFEGDGMFWQGQHLMVQCMLFSLFHSYTSDVYLPRLERIGYVRDGCCPL